MIHDLELMRLREQYESRLHHVTSHHLNQRSQGRSSRSAVDGRLRASRVGDAVRLETSSQSRVCSAVEEGSGKWEVGITRASATEHGTRNQVWRDSPLGKEYHHIIIFGGSLGTAKMTFFFQDSSQRSAKYMADDVFRMLANTLRSVVGSILSFQV